VKQVTCQPIRGDSNRQIVFVFPWVDAVAIHLYGRRILSLTQASFEGLLLLSAALIV
jgi:hypothetical protein